METVCPDCKGMTKQIPCDRCGMISDNSLKESAKGVCSCGNVATKVAMDSEVGPDLMCDGCAAKWLARGNMNEATVFGVLEI